MALPERLEREESERAVAYSQASGAGVADFYIDGELQLSEPFENSWQSDGRPKPHRDSKRSREQECAEKLEERWSQTGYPHRRFNEQTAFW